MPQKNRRVKPTSEHKRAVIALYHSKTIQEIADVMPFSAVTVRKILVEKGILLKKGVRRPGKQHSKRNKRHPAWKEQERIIHLYLEHKWTLKVISIKYGCSIQVIDSILKENGIKLRSKREAHRYRHDKYESGNVKDLLEYQRNRLLDLLGKWIQDIHENGCAPDCRALARRYNLPFDLVWNVYCEIKRLLEAEK